MQDQNRYLRDWLEHTEPITSDWISIAQVPFTRKQVVVNDILTTGDAGGLIALLAGDGIAMALESGNLAGRCVHEYLMDGHSPARLAGNYQNKWRKKFRQRLTLSYHLQATMMQPLWTKPALHILDIFPGAGRALIRQTRGMVDEIDHKS